MTYSTADIPKRFTMFFTIYRDKAGEFRWSLMAKNGNIIADSAEGYKRKASVLKAIERIKTQVPFAEII